MADAPTKTVSDSEPSKAASAAVKAVLDQIARLSQAKKTADKTEMDQLRDMAEKVHIELVNENLIRTVGMAMDDAVSNADVDPATASSGSRIDAAPGANGNSPARANSAAYTSQMQAYRENA